MIRRTLCLLCLVALGIGPISPAQPIASPEVLVDDQVVVEAQNVWYLTFDVDTRLVPNPIVIGQFEARGGSGNDIEILIGFRDEFLNGINGHGGKVLYSSGKKTTGKVAVALPRSGQYVVAFSNKYSLLSRKVVRGRFELRSGMATRE